MAAAGGDKELRDQSLEADHVVGRPDEVVVAGVAEGVVGGRFVIEDMFREVTLYPAGNLEKTVYTNPVFGGMRDFTDTFRNRIHRFLEQVVAGDSPEEIDGSGADGLAAQKVLAAAIESLDRGTVVTME